LLAFSSHLGLNPLQGWVDVLKVLQIPGAPLALRLVHTQVIEQIALRFRAAHQIYAIAEVFSMITQAALFALIAFWLLHVFASRRTGQTWLRLSQENRR
jgi:hypothetical protein